ncbi:dynamin family protein [Pseudooceanicola sp. LIPI14-2-Ac024]|uniref:dynamin family protein n=1 Tax=Pseudooceanicola sp. LIPI14-2-Ac024 TaxID=3344875 RepID=UPI0035D052AE
MYEDATPTSRTSRPVNENRLIATAFDGLEPLAERLAEVDATLARHAKSPDRAILAEARRLRRMIREFEPSVTMIGQVKAGKTTLINAMCGWPDLLPADVNPWTSVVTSLHLVPRHGRGAGRASFQFFSEDGWNHLLKRGGRVGELASRAGADEEVAKVRRQLEEMREKSRARLGRRFEMLLGQSHDYDSFDEELIERYVCLGDDFWDDGDGPQNQGRFADITKSADLWVARPELPVGLCIRDTPGVNDTFMVREQITIRALRGSRICVLVLSAQQALTSVDLALIRLISNVKSRDVIIFVNRIDELADPGREVPEIHASIVETLKKHDGPADAEILFGSGLWAGSALAGSFETLAPDSAQALLNWAEACMEDDTPRESTEEMIWHLSGVPALGQAIAERVTKEEGAVLEARLERGARNLQQSQTVARAVRDLPQGAAALASAETILSQYDAIATEALHAFDARFAALQQNFQERVESARQRFLSRATTALIKHLDIYGENEVWTYDPTGLRLLLRSSYAVFVKSAHKIGDEALTTSAARISDLYRMGFEVQDQDFALQPPPLPEAAPPVVLGQTIALDMSGGWWSRFWRRYRGYDAYVDSFSKLIFEETKPIADALKADNADALEQAMRETLCGFLEGQRAIIAEMVQTPHAPQPGDEAAQDQEPKTDRPRRARRLRFARS